MTPEIMHQMSRLTAARKFVILAARFLGTHTTVEDLAVCLECERTESETLAALMNS